MNDHDSVRHVRSGDGIRARWMAQDLVQMRVIIPDPTYVFPRNHGESAVDWFPVHARVVGVPEQRHAVRCGLPAGLPDCNSALRVSCEVRLGQVRLG